MLYEIEQRVLAILRTIPDLAAPEVFVQSADSIPKPFAIVSVQPFNLASSASALFTPVVPCDIRLYVQQVNIGSELQNYYSTAEYVDAIMRKFASLPALQYQDTGLANVGPGNIQIRLQQAFDRPLRYPPGFGDGQLFWGAVIRLDIPYQERIKINVSGDIT